jgi:hypothetical protein
MQNRLSRPAFVLALALAATALYGAAPGIPGAARACDDGPLLFRGVITAVEALRSKHNDVEGGEIVYEETVYQRTITYDTPDGARTLISRGTGCPRSTGLLMGASVEVVLDHRGELVSLRVVH